MNPASAIPDITTFYIQEIGALLFELLVNRDSLEDDPDDAT